MFKSEKQISNRELLRLIVCYVPNLRFPKDKKLWAKHLLGNIAVLLKGNGISKSDLSETGKPCILYGQLYTTYKNEVIREVTSKTDVILNNSVSSLFNDVIIPGSGETPEDIATACCVLADNVLYGGDLNIIRLTNDYDGRFISYQLNGKRKFDIARIAQGKSIVHLHNDDLQNLEIFYPEDSQIAIKIVDLLEKIDSRIEAQSKIIDRMESLIKSINNHMISKSIEKISLGELCEFMPKTTHKSGDGMSSGDYLFFTNENETVKRFDSYDFDGEYIISNTGGCANFKYYNGKFAVMSDCLVIRFFESQLTNFYINVLWQYQRYIEYIGFEGSGLKHLNKEWLLKLKVPVINEQVKKYLILIDDLKEKIKKEKDMLELYKKQKAYLLQNLFI